MTSAEKLPRTKRAVRLLPFFPAARERAAEANRGGKIGLFSPRFCCRTPARPSGSAVTGRPCVTDLANIYSLYAIGVKSAKWATRAPLPQLEAPPLRIWTPDSTLPRRKSDEIPPPSHTSDPEEASVPTSRPWPARKAPETNKNRWKVAREPSRPATPLVRHFLLEVKTGRGFLVLTDFRRKNTSRIIPGRTHRLDNHTPLIVFT